MRHSSKGHTQSDFWYESYFLEDIFYFSPVLCLQLWEVKMEFSVDVSCLMTIRKSREEGGGLDRLPRPAGHCGGGYRGGYTVV